MNDHFIRDHSDGIYLSVFLTAKKLAVMGVILILYLSGNGIDLPDA